LKPIEFTPPPNLPAEVPGQDIRRWANVVSDSATPLSVTPNCQKAVAIVVHRMEVQLMRYLLFFLSIFIVACDSEHGWVKIEKPVVNQALGGIWGGGEYLLIATDGGQVLWWEPAVERFGYGTAIATEATLTASFALVSGSVPAFPVPPGYDGTLATCVATGTIQERQSMTVSVECTDSDGNEYLSAPDVTLTYASSYNRGSSLATIAGLYDIGLNVPSVLDINADGTLFSQEAVTECVTNGLVSIIDPDFNLYAVSVAILNCNDDTAWLNGMSGTGFFSLDNEFQPGTETLIYLGINELDGVRWGRYFDAPRIN